MDFSKKELKSLGLRFWKFIKSFCVFILCFIPWVGLIFGVGSLIVLGLDRLGVPHRISATIVSIIVSVAPLIPTLIIWNHRKEGTPEDDIGGAVMDCCFMAWIVIIIAVWRLL